MPCVPMSFHPCLRRCRFGRLLVGGAPKQQASDTMMTRHVRFLTDPLLGDAVFSSSSSFCL